MTRRDVKVVQPGLIYVIQGAAGMDLENSTGSTASPVLPAKDLTASDDRSRRAARRERKRLEQEKRLEDRMLVAPKDEDKPLGPIYVA